MTLLIESKKIEIYILDVILFSLDILTNGLTLFGVKLPSYKIENMTVILNDLL